MSDCHIWFGVDRSKKRGRVMLCGCLFREGTINDSAPSVRRTVSGLALRKKARFNRWEIRLTPKRGSRFLISTIFSRTGSGSFRRLPAATTPLRSPASPCSSYAFVQRRITSGLHPTSLLSSETGIPSSNLNFTQRSFNSNPYRFPYRLSFPLLLFFASSTSSMGTLLSPSQECHPFYPSSLSHDLVVSPDPQGLPFVIFLFHDPLDASLERPMGLSFLLPVQKDDVPYRA